ncbi:hypothetical protein BTHI11S_01454 [Bosea thiooxidans]
MMTRLVPPERLGWLSGTGWAIGYLGGLFSLAITLGLLAADPHTGKTLAGIAPILGLDAVAREGDRFSGPLTALWFVIFVTPMFLFTPDSHRTGLSFAEAARGGVGRLRDTLAELPKQPSLGRFLLANMVYQDALVALFAFGGIYAAGVFGWQTIELGASAYCSPSPALSALGLAASSTTPSAASRWCSALSPACSSPASASSRSAPTISCS